MTGTVAQRFRPGEEVPWELLPGADPRTSRARATSSGGRWTPLTGAAFQRERPHPLRGEVLYCYRVEAREAEPESDHEAIVELEQHHHAAAPDGRGEPLGFRQSPHVKRPPPRGGP
ncbi:MAG: hypothetical protein N2507_01195 [Candidatus Bipolaricaulota bacterium]|nr:hypothetical protein [Candidatus Bipolaricaulota bacterium]